MQKKRMKAMILAAGIGSRLKPLTDTMPKPLLKIDEYTLLEITIAYLKSYGVSDIIINVHHHAQKLIDYVQDNQQFGVSISFSDESNKLLNTGGGVYHARHFFDDNMPFVLTASDILTDLDLNKMLKWHNESKNLVTLAVKKRNTSRSLMADENQKLAGWRDNRDGNQVLVKDKKGCYEFGFSGIHVINPVFFDEVKSKGAFGIVDEYLNLAKDFPIGLFDHSETNWFEFGRMQTLEEASQNAEILTLIKKLFKH
ncbi:MAG: NTP transferase domain-containing protein [Bacteroidales bacterium]|nr:NTP transferase domain-containing protein [Bacteroidales bacterium]